MLSRVPPGMTPFASVLAPLLTSPMNIQATVVPDPISLSDGCEKGLWLGILIGVLGGAMLLGGRQGVLIGISLGIGAGIITRCLILDMFWPDDLLPMSDNSKDWVLKITVIGGLLWAAYGISRGYKGEGIFRYALYGTASGIVFGIITGLLDFNVRWH